MYPLSADLSEWLRLKGKSLKMFHMVLRTKIFFLKTSICVGGFENRGCLRIGFLRIGVLENRGFENGGV